MHHAWGQGMSRAVRTTGEKPRKRKVAAGIILEQHSTSGLLSEPETIFLRSGIRPLFWRKKERKILNHSPCLCSELCCSFWKLKLVRPSYQRDAYTNREGWKHFHLSQPFPSLGVGQGSTCVLTAGSCTCQFVTKSFRSSQPKSPSKTLYGPFVPMVLRTGKQVLYVAGSRGNGPRNTPCWPFCPPPKVI